LSSTADIVIIGAGIQGASVAYHLSSLAGDARVVVVERAAQAGTGATAASAAMVMHQTGDEQITRLAKLSLSRYSSLSDALGVDIGFQETGSILFSADAALSARLADLAAFQQRLGIPTESISANDIRRLTNDLIHSNDMLVASYCSTDGYVDPETVVAGYLDNAKSSGVELRLHTQASGIVMRGESVAGVQLENGDVLSTPCVINCAGSEARRVGGWVGIELPITSSRRNMMVLEAPPGPGDLPFPIVEDFDTEWYFRKHPRGILMGIGPTEVVPDTEGVSQPAYNPVHEGDVVAYLETHAPSLLPLRQILSWAGDRPMIDGAIEGTRGGVDALPILGGVAGLDGYFHSCGWGAFGVTLAPIGGELTAQAVCGERPTVDLAPFAWERFADQLTNSRPVHDG
jgi:sarcosine oxidase, subunit beta